MTAKTSFIITNLIGLAAALAFYFNSQQPAELNCFGMSFSMSAGLIAVLSYVSGVLIGGVSIVPFLSDKQHNNVAKLKAWQDQDAKLAVEVQSDKEKQLEAKIATLEAALKQALKK